MLLVDRRGDDAFTLQVTDQSACQDVGARERITVGNRVDAIVGTDAEHGDLPAIKQRGNAVIGHDLVEYADRPPGNGCIHHASSATTGMFLNVARSSSRAGRIWPRSSTNTTLSSPDSLLTNVRNRLSVSGSLIAVFHSS